MPPLWQRIGIIVLFFIAVIMFGFFLYWFFWRPILAPEVPPEGATTTAQLTGAGPAGTRTTSTAGGQLTSSELLNAINQVSPTGAQLPINASAQALVKVPALFSVMTTGGQIVYYNATDGKFYRVDPNGNITALSDQVFYNVQNTIFDHAGDKAILEYPDGSNIVYDFTTQKQITLPKHWADFEFATDNETITFKNMGLDVENRFLVTAKYDGSNAKIIEEIGVNADKVQPNWSPNSQVVATYTEGKDAGRSEVFFLGQNNENFKSMVVEGQDFRGEWSPSGNRMLYSVYDPANDYKPQLWISDAGGDNIGNNRQPIALQTWADRCSFAGDSVALCSVPQTMPVGAGLDQGVLAGIPDQIYAVNLDTGATRLISSPQNVSQISQVMYSDKSPDQLYLTDASTNNIYQINLLGQ
jgi:hypothetical protein